MKTVKLSLIVLLVIISLNTCVAGKQTSPKRLRILDFSGHYQCKVFDEKDKWLPQDLVIKKNSKNSHSKEGLGAYTIHFTLPPNKKVSGLPPHISVKGAMATNGNMIAMNFRNTNPKASTDYGTIIGIATHYLGKRTVLHLFSYEPAYKGGDNSFAKCTKVS